MLMLDGILVVILGYLRDDLGKFDDIVSRSDGASRHYYFGDFGFASRRFAASTCVPTLFTANVQRVNCVPEFSS